MKIENTFKVVINSTFVGGCIALIQVLINLNESTKTKLYDEAALLKLNDKTHREKLEHCIERYYKNGIWDYSNLKHLNESRIIHYTPIR